MARECQCRGRHLSIIRDLWPVKVNPGPNIANLWPVKVMEGVIYGPLMSILGQL